MTCRTGYRSISVENLGFSYPDAGAPVLKDVSMEIKRGETVALVGENGAGKTTLAKLLCRLYDPTSGAILWDDRDLSTAIRRTCGRGSR